MGVRVSQVKAMKLFQITPCVNHFQTLNNLGSRQPVGASKNSLLPFIFDISHPLMMRNVPNYPTTVLNESNVPLDTV